MNNYRNECFRATLLAFVVLGAVLMIGAVVNSVTGSHIVRVSEFDYLKNAVELSVFGIISTTIDYLDRDIRRKKRLRNSIKQLKHPKIVSIKRYSKSNEG